MGIEKLLEEEIEQMEAMMGNRVEETAPTTDEEESSTTEEAQSNEVVETISDNSREVQESVTEKPKKEDWEHRYKTYKASTDVTISNLRREVVTLTESNISNAKRIDELQLKLKEYQESNPEDIYKDLFSTEERDIVGEDTIATMKKATKAAVEAAVRPLQEELEREKQLRQKVHEHQLQEASNSLQSTFLESLENLFPNYVQYDTDPKFHQWMNEVDSFSRVQRSTLFKTAQSIGDARRVAEFFKEYEDTLVRKTEELDSHITPSKSGSVAPKQEMPKKDQPLTRQFVDQFFEDCVRGKYKHKEKLRQEIENKIDRAIATGSII